MKLLFNRVQIKEIGFAPSAIEKAGLDTTWEFSEKLRTLNNKRIAVVEYIGVECKSVAPGTVILYNVNYARPTDLSGKSTIVINEDNILGFYEGIDPEENSIDMTKIKFTPLGDRIVVKRDVKESPKNPHKLVIPETAKNVELTGEVLKVGIGHVDNPRTLKEGDKILFGKSSGIEIELAEGKFILMREADVYGIF